VRDILTEIQRTTERAVMVTEQGSKDVQRGMELASRAGGVILDLSTTIDKSAQAATSIAATTHQQIAGMNQLAEAMQSIKQASSQTTESTRLAEVSSE
jgi:methyl-accepting chemotaxis protein